MAIHDNGDPWSGTTYKGFAGGPTPDPAAGPPTRRRIGGLLLAGGVGAALALGVAFGFLMRPQLISSKPAAPNLAAPATAAADTPGANQVPIAVSAPPEPEPVPRAPEKLQTLPPEMAAAARVPVPPPAVATQPPPAVETDETPAPPNATMSEQAPAPRFRASFDCDTARPGAEEMVCADAGLAAADRQMARAYRRAMASGFDPFDLRQEQRDWVAIREDAARHSEHALANVYDQRIRELNEIADSAPPAMAEDDRRPR